MIIGIDASRANEEKKTGVGWYAWHVIQEFKRIKNSELRIQNGQPVKVVLYTNKPLQGELADLPEGWSEKVLGWPPFGSVQGNSWRLWTQIRLSWEMLFHAPDVLFIPAHVFPIIHPKKTVMTVHDIATIRFPEAYNWFEKWYTLWSARFALKNLWKIITPSNFTKEELEKLEIGNWKFGDDKIKVVYHGYDENYKKIEDKIKIEEVLDKYKIEKPYLLSIGRLETKKNTVNIIKAFEELRIKNYELRLVLVGGRGYGYEDIQKAIGNSPYKNDIIIPGWLENEDLPYLMSGAEVFVFPSLYEGFGIPVLEAQACGTPIVASKDSSLEEVGGVGCVYVDPMSLDELVGGILKLIENVEYRMLNIEKGFKNIERFSWEKCAKETLDVLLRD